MYVFFEETSDFHVDASFMKMFCTCFIESILRFSIMCWYGNLNVKNRGKLNSIVKMCSNIVTGRTRRETCGSICKALFQNMVLIQAGSINSKQVWQGQDTE